jgi:Ser/Thr protein kinase RdoA (MazF antagonist)
MSEDPNSTCLADDVERATALLTAVATEALPKFGFESVATLRLVHYRENAVFRVDAPGEPHPWVMRVHRLAYRTPQEIRSELAWTAALRTDSVHTAITRPAANGDTLAIVGAPGLHEPRTVTVLGWINGIPLAEDDSSDAYRLVGRTSALIQCHGRSWVPPSWFTRPVWDLDGLVGARSLWGDYADLASLGDGRRRLMDRAAAFVRQRLEEFGRGPDRFGLAHADLMPDNVLVENGAPYVIDFDDCGYGWYLYDLATLLAIRTGDPEATRVRDAWVEGYRSVAPLPDEHLEMLDVLVMARLLLGLGWMHTRRETPLAQALTETVIEMACFQAESLLQRGGTT